MAATINEYHQKMDKIFNYLGGKCVKCDTMDNLEVDHKDHTEKKFVISSSWGLSWNKLVIELTKCQLLCKDCHLEKSISEGSLAKGWTNESRQKHGTVWSYTKYKCRCVDCKLAKSIAMKKQYLCLAQSG